MVVVALHGRKRSGKSTLAKAAAESMDPRLRYALTASHPPAGFADPLKAGVKAMFGIDEEPADKERYYPEYRMTYRQMLQRVGMAMRETEWPGGPMTDRFGHEVTFWVKRMDERIKEEQEREGNVGNNAGKFGKAFLWVIDDLRLPDEAEWVRRMGGIMVKIVRPSQPPNTDPHVSEVPLPDSMFDVLVTNDDTDPERLARPIMGSLLSWAHSNRLPLGRNSRDDDE